MYQKYTQAHVMGPIKIPKKSFIDFPDPSENVLGQAYARGRPDASGSPLGVTLWSKIKNLCGNHML